MTARKNQPQPIILKGVILKAAPFLGPFRRTRLRFEISHELVLRRIKSCPSTQSINGFESGRRNQPWSRVPGHSTLWPQAQRSRKGFVHRLFGKIKIAANGSELPGFVPNPRDRESRAIRGSAHVSARG